ncbi:MAG: cysteine desulfurase family protein [bacterium]|nr:cysteine desulfurase family protein [bacterium]
MKKMREKRRIYLDHASTTPLSARVRRVMAPFFDLSYGNPSAIYKEGVVAKEALREARKTAASVLGARSDEIIFTGSGTEADNLALLGTFEAARKKTPHFITTVIEHPAVLEACRYIEQSGGSVTYLPVDQKGIVRPENVRRALTPKTVLVSVMYVNNEIGTIQPIKEIGRMLRSYRDKEKSRFPYFHTDASQAPNYLPVNVERLSVDLMTLDGSKIYGPKGVGMLYKRRGITLEPVIRGGGQEGGLRSGTENMAAIVGMGAALEEAAATREKESKRLKKLQEYFFSRLNEVLPKAIVNGSRSERVPNNINICIEGLDGEYAVLLLDARGVACSTSSSCRTLGENSSSYVINSLGNGRRCAGSSLRFTMGRGTTRRELDTVLGLLGEVASLGARR